MKTWVARLLVLVVFIINIQCAISFLVFPDQSLASYELSGVPGIAALQGMGVAFLMWNVTYPAVIVRPDKFRALFVVVIIQQVIGIAGESYILATLPSGHDALFGGLLRFIIFDGCGLILLVIAFIMSWPRTSKDNHNALAAHVSEGNSEQTDHEETEVEKTTLR